MNGSRIVAAFTLTIALPYALDAATASKPPARVQPTQTTHPAARPGPAQQLARLEAASKWVAIFNYTVAPPDIPAMKRLRATGGSQQRAQALTLENAANLQVMTGLESLELGPTADDAWVGYCAELHNLREFAMLPASKLTDRSAEILSRLTNLRELKLPDAKITDAGFAHFVNSTQLTLLNLTRVPITDASLPIVGKMKDLTYLALSFTQITDAGLPHLYDLPKLTRIDLQGKGCTPAGIAALKAKLPAGCRIVYP